MNAWARFTETEARRINGISRACPSWRGSRACGARWPSGSTRRSTATRRCSRATPSPSMCGPAACRTRAPARGCPTTLQAGGARRVHEFRPGHRPAHHHRGGQLLPRHDRRIEPLRVALHPGPPKRLRRPLNVRITCEKREAALRPPVLISRVPFGACRAHGELTDADGGQIFFDDLFPARVARGKTAVPAGRASPAFRRGR